MVASAIWGRSNIVSPYLMAKIGCLLASDALYLDQYSKHDFYLFARRPVLDADDLLGRIEHTSDWIVLAKLLTALGLV